MEEEVTVLQRCTNSRHLVAQATKFCTLLPNILTNYCSICSLTYHGVYQLTCSELIVLDDIEYTDDVELASCDPSGA